MSDEVEAILRTLNCSYCGAIEGQRCRSKSGKVRSESHAERWYLAVRSGLLPVGDHA